MSELMIKASWFSLLQKKALETFERLGFPDKHHEDWKYTSLDGLLQHQFHVPDFESTPGLASEPLPLEGFVLRILNGVVQIPDNLPNGLIVLPIFEAVERYPELVKAAFQTFKHENAFQALNTARISTGLFIWLQEGLQLSKPLIIQQQQSRPDELVHTRHLVMADAGVTASLVEVLEGESCYFGNTVSLCHLAERSSLVYYKLARESRESFHIGHLQVRQKKDSQFKSHSLGLGSALSRNSLTIFLEEEGADCLLNGIYLPQDKQQIENHIQIHHLVPNCSSFQDYKGIVQDAARSVFKGTVVVAKHAQKTRAHQTNKNLLLSAKAEVYTQPQLEIFADDVICSHGATVGQLEEEALFYLRTRGFSPEEASFWLIRAFLTENLNHILQEQLRAWMNTLINQQLGVGNDDAI